MSEQDAVNAQHLAAMGLADVQLGKPYSERSLPLDDPDRCDAHHPNNLQVRCVLKKGHATRHVRGTLRWTDEDKPFDPEAIRSGLR